MMPEFDWCNFCKYDDYYSGATIECRRCVYSETKKPSHFEEKASVTAYRRAIKENNNA